MTSVVDTSVKHWNYLMDGSAKPTLPGAAGSLIALLDALIAGFDSKSCTISVTGTLATVSWSGLHSCLPQSVVTIAGCTGAWTALNGEQKIVNKVAGSTSATFNVAPGTTAGSVTGTITIAMAPLPYWSKVYSGTNTAVYRSSDPFGLGMYLNIDDTGAQWARVTGYETMTAVATGTGPFPTAAQIAGGGYWPKSVAAGATGWTVVADSRGIYFIPIPGLVNSSGYQSSSARFFGDMIPLRTGGDPWCCALNYSSVSSVASQQDGQVDGNSTAPAQTALPRLATGLGTSQLHVVYPYTGTVPSCSGGDAFLGSFPSQYDGALRLSKKFIFAGGPRAEFPGFYHMPQSGAFDAFKTGQYVTGSGALAGKVFLAVNSSSAGFASAASSTGNTGAAFLDVTGPWR
jgi:hypothetical protein